MARFVRRRFPLCRVLVLCGPGHNGGDGFAAALLLRRAGWPVRCVQMLPEVAYASETASFANRWAAGGGLTLPFTADLLAQSGLILDAVFGTGLSRPVTGTIAAAFGQIHAAGLPVVALDLPSGLATDSGEILGCVLAASATVTFGWYKPAHVLLPGKACCGDLILADIGLVPPLPDAVPAHILRNDPVLWQDILPHSAADAHKYTRGHVVVVGGATATGAARLAATAAARMGCGLVSLLFPASAAALYSGPPYSLLTRPFHDLPEAAALLGAAQTTAALIGPGTGVTPATRTLVLAALASGHPTVLDADALTCFQHDPETLFSALRGKPAVLTPHAGEFARLFACTAGSKLVQARAAAMLCGAVLVLKGNDTVIATPDGKMLVINTTAPATLATGGSGDVLAGMIAGLLAQGMLPFPAASAAVFLHGEAARYGGMGLIADDLPAALSAVLAGLHQ